MCRDGTDKREEFNITELHFKNNFDDNFTKHKHMRKVNVLTDPNKTLKFYFISLRYLVLQ
jgi:hypothetical protein